jgi:uncharacterized protein (TIGR02996 family)
MSSEIDPTKPSHYNNLNSTSQEVAAFIAAIAANPDDDTARLVFADWIEEHLRDRELAELYRGGARKWMEEFVAGEFTCTNYGAHVRSKDMTWLPVTVADVLKAGHEFLDSEGSEWFVQTGEEGLRNKMYDGDTLTTFWRCFEILTGRIVDPNPEWFDYGMSPISCSC